jgi:hypothetical protein
MRASEARRSSENWKLARKTGVISKTVELAEISGGWGIKAGAAARPAGVTNGWWTLAVRVVKLQPPVSTAAVKTQKPPKVLGRPTINCLEPLKRKP